MSKHAVPRLWPGETVVCIASGPSLAPEDVDYVRGKARVIVVNTSYQLAPWADVLYACDAKWWRWHKGAPDFPGLKYSLQRDAKFYCPTLKVLENTGAEGLEVKPTGLRNGRNGGYQAINLAVHFGAARILLLGYDMGQGLNREEHWHSEHPNRSRSPFDVFRRVFPSIVEPLQAVGVEVINCSRRTVLTCFPQLPIEVALPVAHEAVA
jgi:hypothetical protein